METKTFLTVFFTLFLAELGDKTQLATVLYAADGQVQRWLVFAAAASALVLSTALAVLLGSVLMQWLNPAVVQKIAGAGFVLVGLWTLLQPHG